MTETKPFSAASKNLNSRIARLLAVTIALSALLFTACGGGSESTTNTNRGSAPATPTKPAPPGNTAVLETDAGTIKIELLPNDSPKTVENFKLLADSNFYNGLVFHRIASGFMIQGGDPNGNGTGGRTATGQPLPNEINASSPLYQAGYRRGIVAMANRGRPETGSCQFFIMHGNNSPLPPVYTIFGRVTEGIEVVDKIATASLSAPERPAVPVVMKRVYIQ